MTQIENIIMSLKRRPGISNVGDELLNDFVNDAIVEIKEYCNVIEGEELPNGCIGIVKELVIIRINKLGSEGLSSESYSGVSQSYIEDMPKDILRKLRRYRKLPR